MGTLLSSDTIKSVFMCMCVCVHLLAGGYKEKGVGGGVLALWTHSASRLRSDGCLTPVALTVASESQEGAHVEGSSATGGRTRTGRKPRTETLYSYVKMLS